MRAVQVARPNGPLELVEREIPQPGPGMVRIKVQACGVCHSDSLVKEGHWPGLRYPRVPGHEVIGTVDAVGEGVLQWKPGRRVGVGWHGGNCGYCDACRNGDFFACTVNLQITGLSFDGGYADFIVAPAIALASVPDELSAVEAAPLMCAGVTTFNALRNSGARPGDLVAVLGLGGLGHLGVQYAAKMGFRTVAIARGQDKAALARQLGAKGLHRQPGAKTIGGTPQAGRRKGDSGNSHKRRCDECRNGRPRHQRNSDGRRRRRSVNGFTFLAHRRKTVLERLVFRNGCRFSGYPRVQRAHRSGLHERGSPAGPCCRGL